MITAFYKGKKPQNLRAGTVKKNGRIELREEEAFTIRDNAEWNLEPEALPESTPPNLRPVKGIYFDLSALPWKSKAIFPAVTRLGRPMLVKALSQLEACGVPIQAIHNTDDTSELRERFLELTRKLGWF
jgi:hypothetical protein